MAIHIGRRGFIIALGGTTAAWPLAVHAQQGERMRRIGVLMPGTSDDQMNQARLAAFLQGLQLLGWTDGRNVRIDTRFGADDADISRKHARELIALVPDVVMAYSSNAVSPLLQLTRTVPIVFAAVTDPVGAGYVESLARPGGNVTGFIGFEYTLSAKWLGLLKEIVPRVTRVGVIRDPAIAAGPAQFAVIQAAAPLLGVELRPVDARNAGAIERAITAFAGSSNDAGLIVTGSLAASINRALIITLAARHRLPAIYYSRYYTTDGGLISYGPDFIDQCQRAAGYVDRILKGEKPSELPLQAPTKYELVINLKTAKALGLTVPDRLISIADEVIE